MHIKNAGSKKQLVMSKDEWLEIGKKAGWSRESAFIMTEFQDLEEDHPINLRANKIADKIEAHMAATEWMDRSKFIRPTLEGIVENLRSRELDLLAHISEAAEKAQEWIGAVTGRSKNSRIPARILPREIHGALLCLASKAKRELIMRAPEES